MDKKIHGQVVIVNLPGTWSLLHRAAIMYRELFWKLVHLTALMALGFLITLSLTLFFGYVGSGNEAFRSLLDLLSAAISAVSVLFYSFIFAAIISMVHFWSKGKQISVANALEYALAHFKSVFFILILQFFIVFGAAILFYVPLVLLMATLFSVWYYLALYIVILEDSRGFEALARSRYLMHGMFFKCLGRAVVPPLIVSLSLLVFLPLLFVHWTLYLGMLIVFGFLATPFIFMYEYLRYHDLAAIDRNIPFHFFPGERRGMIAWATIGGIMLVGGWIMSLYPPQVQAQIRSAIIRPIGESSVPILKNFVTQSDQLFNFLNRFQSRQGE